MKMNNAGLQEGSCVFLCRLSPSEEIGVKKYSIHLW